MDVHKYINIHTICIYTCMYVCMYGCMHACIHIYVYMLTYIYGDDEYDNFYGVITQPNAVARGLDKNNITCQRYAQIPILRPKLRYHNNKPAVVANEKSLQNGYL